LGSKKWIALVADKSDSAAGKSYGREARTSRTETSGDSKQGGGSPRPGSKIDGGYQFVSRPELPRFAGGAVGFIGYEAIHFFEPKVPLAQKDELNCLRRCLWFRARLWFSITGCRSLKIIVNAFSTMVHRKRFMRALSNAWLRLNKS